MQTRTLISSRIERNTGAHLARTKEVGAQEETQDVTEMDALLRITRTYLTL